MDNYQESISQISKPELHQVYELALEAFGEVKPAYGTRKALFDLWYDLSPKSFALIKKNNKAIGYCIVLPSNGTTYRKYIQGKISLFQFNKDNINTKLLKNESRYIYIHTLYIKPAYRTNRESIVKLINTVYILIGIFLKKEKLKDNIFFAEGISELGQKFIKNFDFNRFENDISLDGYPIYHLDFSSMNHDDHDFRQRARKHLEYLIKIKNVPSNV